VRIDAAAQAAAIAACHVCNATSYVQFHSPVGPLLTARAAAPTGPATPPVLRWGSRPSKA